MLPQSRMLLLGAVSIATAMGQTQPLLPEGSVTHVSEHVYAIQGWPNVGIIVGDRATLVVDTGMGPRNGATVVREVQKLAKGPKLYLTTTHFHPEHASGDSAFPPGAILIRPAVQQEEMEARGSEFLDLFRGRSAQFKELLQDVKLRKPDLTFDREVKLDLGGVTTRLMWLGAAHTRGDELTFVEQDSVLFPGDIVENKLVPSMPNADSSAKGWLAILDKLEPPTPRPEPYPAPKPAGAQRHRSLSLSFNLKFARHSKRADIACSANGFPVGYVGLSLRPVPAQVGGAFFFPQHLTGS